MEMTNKILQLGQALQKAEPEIMRVIDKEMTEIMYLDSKKLDEQVARMKVFLQELKQIIPISVRYSSLFEESETLFWFTLFDPNIQ